MTFSICGSAARSIWLRKESNSSDKKSPCTVSESIHTSCLQPNKLDDEDSKKLERVTKRSDPSKEITVQDWCDISTFRSC